MRVWRVEEGVYAAETPLNCGDLWLCLTLHSKILSSTTKVTPVSFIADNWYLFLLAAVSGGLLLWPSFSGGGGSSVSAAEAVMLMNRDKAVVVDVCETAEFANGHIAGAKHAPLGELESKLPSVVKNKATPVVLVCASGARSNRAVSIAKKLGYEHAYSLTGGMGAWRKENLPVEKT